MRNLLAIIFLFYLNCTFGQKGKHYLYSFQDTTSGKALIGYKSIDGKIVIKAKYLNGYDTLKKMAIVLNDRYEYIVIDENDHVLLVPYIYDNGPDYLEEGLFRFVENNKIGFANSDGEKIIAAKYDFATPFNQGLSEYYIGGEKIYENGKTYKQIIAECGSNALIDMHWSWGGEIKEYGYVNKSGQEFIKVKKVKHNKRVVWTKDHKQFLIDNKGRIIKHF